VSILSVVLVGIYCLLGVWGSGGGVFFSLCGVVGCVE